MENKEKSSFIFWLMLAAFIVIAGITTKKDPIPIKMEQVDQELLDETKALLQELQEI